MQDSSNEVCVSVTKEVANFIIRFEGVSDALSLGDHLMSPFLVVEDYMVWMVKYYPGERHDCRLILAHAPPDGQCVKFICHVLDDLDREVYTYASPGSIDFPLDDDATCGLVPLHEANVPLLYNDTIVFKFEIICSWAEKSKDALSPFKRRAVDILAHPAKSICTASSDLLRLADDGASFDAIIVGSDGLETKAHRFVLSMRSDVLRAILNGNLGENDTHEQIQIPEFTTDVIKLFVRFFYSDDIDAADLAQHVWDLHAIAHKYNVLSLQQVCENCVIKQLAPSTVIHVLCKCEQMRSTEKLRREVLLYIARHRRTLVKDGSYMKSFNSYLVDKAKSQNQLSVQIAVSVEPASYRSSAVGSTSNAYVNDANGSDGDSTAAAASEAIDPFLQELLLAMAGEV